MAGKAKGRPVDIVEDFSKLSGDPLDNIKSPGYQLRWCHKEHRDKVGWGIWRPVRKSSELGEKVMEQLSSISDKVYNSSADRETDLIHKDAEAVLTFAPIERAKAFKAYLNKKADDQLATVKRSKQADGTPAVKQQNIIMPIGG